MWDRGVFCGGDVGQRDVLRWGWPEVCPEVRMWGQRDVLRWGLGWGAEGCPAVGVWEAECCSEEEVWGTEGCPVERVYVRVCACVRVSVLGGGRMWRMRVRGMSCGGCWDAAGVVIVVLRVRVRRVAAG